MSIEIRWRTRPDNDAEAELYAGISDEIDAANDGFTLSYEPGTNEGSPYQDQLVTEIANGTAPDVFWIPGTDIARFQKEGLILDLDELADGRRVRHERVLPGADVPPDLRPRDRRSRRQAVGSAP